MPAEALEVDNTTALKEYLEKDYAAFVKMFFEVLEPETDFVSNWHIDYICKQLQDEVERIGRKEKKTGDMVVNIPPRSMKSFMITVFWNAWAWTRFPWMKFITSSYSDKLASDHTMKTRRIIESELYQRLWGNVFEIRKEIDSKSWFENDKGGVRRSAGVTGTILGGGCDILITDDPTNPKKLTDSGLETATTFWDNIAFSRLNDQQVGLRVIVMQRLHERDLTGHIIERYAGTMGKLNRIILPGEDIFDVQPPELKKFYIDGLLWPERFPREVLDDYRKNLREVGYANQIGQAPTPDSGIIFKREWMMKRWKTLPEGAGDDGTPLKKGTWASSWDLTFVEDGSSFVVGQVWYVNKPDLYLVNQYREKSGFLGQLKAIEKIRQRYPFAIRTIIEKAANGSAVIATLGQKMQGIIPWPATGSKEARAESTTMYWEAGNIWLPEDDVKNAWVDDYIREHIVFPRGKNDDQVDATSQFLNWFTMMSRRRSFAPRETVIELQRYE